MVNGILWYFSFGNTYLYTYDGSNKVWAPNFESEFLQSTWRDYVCPYVAWPSTTTT